MTNKERQAKLQYLLNSLSMTKEQKDIVVDLVNSSSNGGGNGEDNIVEIYINSRDITGSTGSEISMTIDDIQSDFFESVVSENINATRILNEQLTNILKEHIITNKQFVIKENAGIDITVINPSIVLTTDIESQKDIIYITMSLSDQVTVISVTY